MKHKSSIYTVTDGTNSTIDGVSINDGHKILLKNVDEGTYKMKHKFKVGDRVKVYTSSPYIGEISMCFSHDDLLEVKENESFTVVHYKQCRKLKEKKKPMEFWINAYKDGSLSIYSDEEKSKKDRGDRLELWFKVREVLEK